MSSTSRLRGDRINSLGPHLHLTHFPRSTFAQPSSASPSSFVTFSPLPRREQSIRALVPKIPAASLVYTFNSSSSCHRSTKRLPLCESLSSLPALPLEGRNSSHTSHEWGKKRSQRKLSSWRKKKETEQTGAHRVWKMLLRAPTLGTCNHCAPCIKKRRREEKISHDEISVHSFFHSLPVRFAPSLFLSHKLGQIHMGWELWRCYTSDPAPSPRSALTLFTARPALLLCRKLQSATTNGHFWIPGLP